MHHELNKLTEFSYEPSSKMLCIQNRLLRHSFEWIPEKKWKKFSQTYCYTKCKIKKLSVDDGSMVQKSPLCDWEMKVQILPSTIKEAINFLKKKGVCVLGMPKIRLPPSPHLQILRVFITIRLNEPKKIES